MKSTIYNAAFLLNTLHQWYHTILKLMQLAFFHEMLHFQDLSMLINIFIYLSIPLVKDICIVFVLSV